jgi:demethylmacrocin O-methyltransferase
VGYIHVTVGMDSAYRYLEPFKEISAVRSLRALLARAVPVKLNALAILYGADKSSRHHDYARQYAHHLRARRRSVRSVLEIGVGGYGSPFKGGPSLRMWRTYFPNAQIYGLDIEAKQLPPEKRITVIQGDQGNHQFLVSLAQKYGPFDLVIDDGSHFGRHQHASFNALFPTLLPGAMYVIEDLETSYWENWEGGPVGTPGTGVDLVKGLIDSIHLGPVAVANLHVYPALAFIEKASESRQGKPPVPLPGDPSLK